MLIVPRFGKERLFNKVALIAFIAKHMNILVFKLYYYFKDNKAIYLIIKYINKTYISELKEEKWKVIKKELKLYLKTLKKLKFRV
jgi:hypothetical protein